MTASDLSAWVADARLVSVLEVIDRRGIKLRRAGAEMVGPCPVCGGIDRFGVNSRKNLWHCRGSGRGGDAIALVEYLDGADFLAACEDLTGRPPPRGEGTRASLEELAAREAERRAAAEAREKTASTYRERERHRLYRMWREARPLPGTPAETYLALRGIPLPRSAALRFLPRAAYFHGSHTLEDGRSAQRIIGEGPALAAAITNAEGRFAGLHMTWIDLANKAGDYKMDWWCPDTGEHLPAKKVRGSKQGGAIVLVRAMGAPLRQVSGEGIETTLSVWAAFIAAGRLAPDMTFVAGIDLGNLAGRATQTLAHPTLRRADKLGRMMPVRVPGPEPDFTSAAMPVAASVRELLLLQDGDSDPVATGYAMQRAAARHACAGRRVLIAPAPEGRDFNNILRGAA